MECLWPELFLTLLQSFGQLYRPNPKASVSVMLIVNFIYALGMVCKVFCPLICSHLKEDILHLLYLEWLFGFFFFSLFFYCRQRAGVGEGQKERISVFKSILRECV